MKKKKSIRIREMQISYRPFYQRLYSCAYLITGNERTSEKVMIEAMLSEPYPDSKDEKSLWENVKQLSLKRVSREESEFFSFSGTVDQELSPLAESLLGVSDEELRIILLGYSLGLRIHDISFVTGKRADEIRKILSNAENEAVSFVKNEKSARRALAKSCDELMESIVFAPDYNALIRSAEARLEGETLSGQYARSVRSFLNAAVSILFLTAAAFIIWILILFLDYYKEEYIQQKENINLSETLYAEEEICRYWKA